MLQQPAIRITRFLRLQKGSIGSRYAQLYISFTISCLYHKFQMFNVTRKDVGEFVFFMSQPVAITTEDFVQRIWSKLWYQPQTSSLRRFEKASGYVWVFLWFSYSLPTYVKGIRDSDIIRDVLLETRPFGIGTSLAMNLLKSL